VSVTFEKVIVPTPLFPLGRCVATPGALAALVSSCQLPTSFLARHARGDWGVVSPEDKAANDAALEADERLFSSYTLSSGETLWIITEWDRSATTLLLPDEY
jgi:hypothetical protein